MRGKTASTANLRGLTPSLNASMVVMLLRAALYVFGRFRTVLLVGNEGAWSAGWLIVGYVNGRKVDTAAQELGLGCSAQNHTVRHGVLWNC